MDYIWSAQDEVLVHFTSSREGRERELKLVAQSDASHAGHGDARGHQAYFVELRGTFTRALLSSKAAVAKGVSLSSCAQEMKGAVAATLAARQKGCWRVPHAQPPSPKRHGPPFFSQRQATASARTPCHQPPCHMKQP